MNHSSTGTGASYRTPAAAMILMAIALLAYGGIFNAPFLFDDQMAISQNRHIQMTAITADSLAALIDSPGNRFFADLTIALNYYFHGNDVRGYHAVNLLVHFLTAWLMFLVARHTLRLTGTESGLIPLLASALWLVNPVHTQSVTYTVQRMNSLAAMFFMLALYAYIRARITSASGKGRARGFLFYALCLTSGLLGLASKEIAASLPVMLFLYEWYFFQDRNPAWLKKQTGRIVVLAAFCLLLTVLYLGTSPLDQIEKTYQGKKFTPGQRLLSEPGAVLYYLSLLLFPHPDRLTLLHNFPVSSSLVTPLTTPTAILGIAALIAAGILLSGKQRLLSFSVFWFLGNLVIESSVFGLALVFEHRTYLPSIFPFIALTALAVKQPRLSNLSAPILCVLIAVCGAWTCQRNQIWKDGVRFWNDNVAKAPEVPEALNNLGQALLVAEETGRALPFFTSALALDPAMEPARVNLGAALQRLGRPAQAAAQYQTVLKSNPFSIQARYNLAMVLKEQGRTDAAMAQFRRIIAIDPYCSEAFINLGALLIEQRKFDQALSCLADAARTIPGNPRIYNNLGIALHRLGRIEEAAAALRQGLSLAPRDPALHNSLGLVLLDRGQYAEASREFQLAVDIDPRLTEAIHNLGLTAERQGRVNRAVHYYRQALRQSPAYELARCNLASLLLTTGQSESALTLVRGIAVLKPEHRLAVHRLILTLAEARKLEPAAALAEKMAAAAPDDAAIYYNLACLYARQNDPGKAVDRLKKAVELGYDRWDHLKTDPDLETIRDTDYVKRLCNENHPAGRK